jgi:hypothetical protein
VRARIRRGKLAAVKVGALWRVHLPEGEPVVAPNTTVPSRDTPSRHATERVAQHDTTDTPPRNVDLEPLAAVIRDQNHRIEELAAAAAFWQIRARQAEEQLKQLTAGTPESAEDAPERPDLAPGSTETNETAPIGIWSWLKRVLGG